MNCRTCGPNLQPVKTDLPLRGLSLIAKELPVAQCESCSVYEIEDLVFRRVEKLLSAIDRETELETIRFAA